MTRIDYERLASLFLKESGLVIHADLVEDSCPPWCQGDCVHGNHYVISVMDKAEERETLTFDFWESGVDKEKGERPSNYTILSIISATIDSSPYDADENTLKNLEEFTVKAKKFFTPAELEKLEELFS